jgi:monoamine oxidase
MTYDAIIIGGGIGGLYLNYLLLKYKKAKNTILIEKSDYFGGRLFAYKTTVNRKKYIMEAGGGRFNDNHKRYIALIKKFNLTDKIIKLPKKVSLYTKKQKWKKSDLSRYLPYHYMDHLFKGVTLSQNMKKLSFNEWLKKKVEPELFNFILDTYPYTDIFKINAFDAIALYKKDMNITNNFYILYGGMDQVVHALVREIKKMGGALLLNTECLNFTEQNNIFTVTTSHHRKKTIYSNNLCLAIQKPHLLKFPYLKPLFPLIKSVSNARLLRVYAIFDPKCVWFKNISKSISDSKINYIIPINSKKGLIMISYSDESNAIYLNNLYRKSPKIMMDYILKECEKLFNQKIPKPLWFKSFFWQHGVGNWLPGYDSKKMSQKMIKPIKYKKLFICGENYSKIYQGWAEGALETAENVFKKM